MTKSARSTLESRSVAGSTATSYPAPFRDAVAGRLKRVLGDAFGLSDFGVNLVELAPGGASSQRHWHTHEDEFVYVVSGELVLINDDGEHRMQAGTVAGFPAGSANGHQLRNDSPEFATYLEIGSRKADDEVFYPDIDLELRQDGSGGRVFRHRNGEDW